MSKKALQKEANLQGCAQLELKNVENLQRKEKKPSQFDGKFVSRIKIAKSKIVKNCQFETLPTLH
jgi:hypothetical protein